MYMCTCVACTFVQLQCAHLHGCVSKVWKYSTPLATCVLIVYRSNTYQLEPFTPGSGKSYNKGDLRRTICKICASSLPFMLSLIASDTSSNISRHLKSMHIDREDVAKDVNAAAEKRIISTKKSLKKEKSKSSASDSSIMMKYLVRSGIRKTLWTDMSVHDHARIRQLALDAILFSQHSLPLSIFQTSPNRKNYLLELLRVFVPDMPSICQHTVNNMLTDRVIEFKQNFATQVKKLNEFYCFQPFMTIHHDIVAQKVKKVGMLGVSASFRDAELKHHEKALALREISKGHGADKVANMVTNVLEEYGVNVSDHVTDLSSDTTNAARAVVNVLWQRHLNERKAVLQQSTSSFQEYLEELLDESVYGRTKLQNNDCTFHKINRAIMYATGLEHHPNDPFPEGKALANWHIGIYPTFTRGEHADFTELVETQNFHRLPKVKPIAVAQTRAMCFLDCVQRNLVNAKAYDKLSSTDDGRVDASRFEICKESLEASAEWESVLSTLKVWHNLSQSRATITKSYMYLFHLDLVKRLEGKKCFKVIKTDELFKVKTNTKLEDLKRVRRCTNDFTPEGKTFVDRMLRECKDRFSAPDDDELIAMALDPRTKGLGFLSEDLRKKAMGLLRTEYLKFSAGWRKLHPSSDDVVNTSLVDEDMDEESGSEDGMYVNLDVEERNPKHTVLEELEDYVKSPLLKDCFSEAKPKGKCNLLNLRKWYDPEKHMLKVKDKFPIMFRMFAKYVTRVSSNALQERVFSKVRITFNYLRNRMATGKGEKLIIAGQRPASEPKRPNKKAGAKKRLKSI